MSLPPTFEFHVTRACRERYGFDRTLFSLTGNVVFADFAASREFAHRMNLARDAERHPERAVHPGALHAMGLIDEGLHLVAALYREQRDPRAFTDALTWLEQRLGRDAVDRTLLAFTEGFPPAAVHHGEQSASEWLSAETGGTPHRAVALEELLLLWLANRNPAFQPFGELFDDTDLRGGTAYGAMTVQLQVYFETRPRFGPDEQTLVDLLRAPALASPDSLEGQLAYIQRRWRGLLGDFVRRLLTALDVLHEEQVAIWMRFHPPQAFPGGPPGAGPSGTEWVPSFRGLDHEFEAFSPDSDWMPRTVLIAKSVWVWLHQLSVRYGRAIERLDQIPDPELELLARRGFNALWLIGVWERGKASQRIKQLCGNPEAMASAYSLHDYRIAADLGGEASYLDLRGRAARYGLRLASDMVPNHMAVDSRWVIEHPDWFLQLRESPYPAYRFDGPDLSSDGRVEIKIEDHYYDRTDAAVVFRRVDRWTGETRYLYHGNDGTSFPWNDTAQLDYTRADVREAVIQTILHVARLFPIIRFDAAMTLAKRHYQRLWFPEPGSSGAIPTRAERGLTRGELDQRMPQEFWREVVDRVAVEAPGTLLLAEAFWLMEGYFVRTLGMHRVYNSAFMNMLRDEENANYRSVLKNTLEFDPEVLQRYVNFMNNPDERTAVDQFGKGDKYFGICTLMSTLPGLPMFGHGQIEGFTEKYGMEYRRSYHDETPDADLVTRHEREISPLLHRRAVFAEAREFLLYDFFTEQGHVNEDVFAYSNRSGDERALVVYHNRYAETSGWIRLSCVFAGKDPDGEKRLVRRTLGEAFGLADDPGRLVAFRDARSGLEYLHRAQGLVREGLRLELGAYQCHVFLDWRHLDADGPRPWGTLCGILGGRGVPSLDDALNDLVLEPVHRALRALLAPEVVEPLAMCAGARRTITNRARESVAVAEAARRARALLAEVRRLPLERLAGAGPPRAWQGGVEAALRAFESRLTAALRIPALERQLAEPWSAEVRAVLPCGPPRAGRPARGATSGAGRAARGVAPDAGAGASGAAVAAATARGSGAGPVAPVPGTVAPAAAPPAAVWATVLAWCALEALGFLRDPDHPRTGATWVFDALRLRGPMAGRFGDLGLRRDEPWRAAARVRAAHAHGARLRRTGARPGPTTAPFDWLQDADAAWAAGAHVYRGARYVVREPLERLLWWRALPALVTIAGAPRVERGALRALERRVARSLEAAEAAGYDVDRLLAWDPGAVPAGT